MAENHIFGAKGEYTFGPAALYIKTDEGFVPEKFDGASGTGIALGKTGPIEIEPSAEYAEATSVQTGSEPDDFAVSGQSVIINTALKQPGFDIMENVVDGFIVEYHGDGSPRQYHYALDIGGSKRAQSFRMTHVDIVRGQEAWDQPHKIVDYYIVLPMTGETTITKDAENFLEYAISLRAMPDEDNTVENKPLFFSSRETDEPTS